MIPRECKRLAEVDFPIAVVSKHPAREKSIRHGHPSTLHLWWARRPLASSRAVLLALLLPDPCDPHCPEAFKEQATEILGAVRQPPANDDELRKALLWFIGAFANWDMAAHATYLQVGRNLVRAAHGEEAPLVVDPFAGGGSIPLEALRLGCEAFASDLNPVAYLILKVMLEDIPRHGPGLADELRRVGGEIKAAAERELADLYPADPDGATPIAYLWARTVRCEAPNCGAEIPLLRSFWLCKKVSRRRALRCQVERPRGESPRVAFEVLEPRSDREVPNGTVARARATCLCCGAVLPPERVRAQLSAERGGADVVFDEKGRRVGGARMTAVVTLRPDASGRHYRLPTQADYAAARRAQDRIGQVLAEWEQEKVEHLFARQALPMAWDFGEAVPLSSSTGSLGDRLDILVRTISATTEGGNSSRGTNSTQASDATKHALPNETAGVWFTDPPYYDAIPYSDLSDFFFVWLRRALLDHALLRDPFDPDNPLSPKRAEAVQDETKQVDGRAKDRLWFEDTMARAFAEGRRVLREDGVGSVVFAHKTTEGWEALLAGMIRSGWTITASWPIATEMGSRLRARDSAALATSIHLVCRGRPDDASIGDWGDVLRELPARVANWMERLQGEGIRGADLVFACIGPALEIFSRYRAVETAEGRTVALAEYLEKVWEVVGRTALENVLGAAEAKARNGLAGALEEDARLTALFLWTLQATTGEESADASENGGASADETDEGASTGKAKGFSLVFDVVRRFAQPLGVDLPKWEKRTIETRKGVVRLLPVAERAKQLFGDRGAQAVATRLEQDAATGPDALQGVLFPDRQERGSVAIRERRPDYGDRDESPDRSGTVPGATTLDRVHTGMLLQAGGRTNALRALVQAERERGPDFLRLSNALSALYPRGSKEKRLLDAMLLAVPR